jgi:MerR family redox-sensitive transcriptional activator SoxR
MTGLSISKVAQRAGLRPSTLRYYEQVGLLPPQLRVHGRRSYDPAVFDTLAVIVYAKAVGFTIAETKLLVSGFPRDIPASTRWQQLARRKQQEIDDVIARALEMRRTLQRALNCKCHTLAQCGHRIRAHSMTAPPG